MNTGDLLTLKSFCKAKDMAYKAIRRPTQWEKIFTNPTSDRGMVSTIYKKLKKLSSKEQRIQLTKWSTDINRELSTEESKMADRHLRKCSTSFVIREMYIKRSF